MYKITLIVMAILFVAYIAFMLGYISGHEGRDNVMNWGSGWDDGYKAGQETERARQWQEELRKKFAENGGE